MPIDLKMVIEHLANNYDGDIWADMSDIMQTDVKKNVDAFWYEAHGEHIFQEFDDDVDRDGPKENIKTREQVRKERLARRVIKYDRSE